MRGGRDDTAGNSVRSVLILIMWWINWIGRAPNVHVKKSRRAIVQEVEDPDQVVEDADQFFQEILL